MVLEVLWVGTEKFGDLKVQIFHHFQLYSFIILIYENPKSGARLDFKQLPSRTLQPAECVRWPRVSRADREVTHAPNNA